LQKINQYGIAEKYCTKKSMTKEVQTFPTISTDLQMYNISEGESFTGSNYAFDQIK